ncbi:hypothetical protein BGZ65_009301 [Modicella reniformis]|uniref:Arrestin C-terminal-like domain-containing protein n=1 Tax=Modicella reniformis TaxID=1440133 RepID=A0A9P6M217_9FUNG|nr:hypothetical protein BGZ65_009301 [Modicella reniformis]
MSSTPADLRGRRASFSANVDTAVGGFGGLVGRAGRNMSMINISTLSQFPMGDLGADDPSLPEAPSYDPPNYENLFTSIANGRSSEESSVTDTMVASESTATTTELGTAEEAMVAASNLDPAGASEDGSSNAHSRRPSRESRSHQATSTTTPATPPVEPVEPKAVLMQPGNYVIPFSIRIPANTVMTLPGSFSDPVGSISYQLKAVMKQILPSPDPYNPKALIVEPTFTSTSQVIKLIPMNDPAHMPLYNLPFETVSIRANVGHWVWSTGFMEAHAWVPKQGYRPGRVVPLVIHIVNHSDAKQVTVETTLCKCLHYGSGLSKIRAMGIAGQGYLIDPTLIPPTGMPETTEEASSALDERGTDGRRHGRQRRSSIRNNSRQESSIPSPPASPYGSSFPTTTISEHESESPDGSVHRARVTSPSIHSNSSDGNNTSTTSGPIHYSPDSSNSTPSTATTTSLPSAALPIVQHLREKMSKAKTLINCSLAVDREIQKTILVPIPHTTGYSILNAPLLEVSYEIVIKIRVERVYSRDIRLSVPIVVVVPEEGDIEEEEVLLVNAGMASPADMARDLGLELDGDDFDFGGQGECPPYEATK